MILTGAGCVAAALVLLAYIVGSWRAEHRAARQYVDELATLNRERVYLDEQRRALEQQRRALGQQRVSLDLEERRRTPRADQEPTREIPRPPTALGWIERENANKRHHRRADDEGR